MTAMFVILFVCLLMGIPVAFSIGISSAAYLYFFTNLPVSIVVQRMVDGINSFSYLALPLFIMSGAIMVYGSTPRIMKLANLLLGRVPGGLGAAGCLGCGFFGAISGSAVATAASIGSIVAPEMVKQGYDKGFTASLIAAAGTLGIVIPPSVCMVVYAQNAGVSIGTLFMAGFIPGFMAVGLLGALSVFIAKRRNYMGETVAVCSAKEVVLIVIDAALPLLTPVIILGGTLAGIFTATESATVATIYAFILAKFVYRELSWKQVYHTLISAARSSAAILFIISAATPFGWILTMNNMPSKISSAILDSLNSPILIYIAVIAVLIVLGLFMESFTIIILTTPIFVPIMNSIGVDLVSYGVVMIFCICIGACTPPLAVCLFTTCRILKMRIEETIPDVFMVIGILMIMVALIMVFPQIALFLPALIAN